METGGSNDKRLSLANYTNQRAYCSDLDACPTNDSFSLMLPFHDSCESLSRQTKPMSDPDRSQRQLQEAISTTELLLSLPLDGPNEDTYHGHVPGHVHRHQGRSTTISDNRKSLGSSGHIRRSFRNLSIPNIHQNSFTSATLADDASVTSLSLSSLCFASNSVASIPSVKTFPAASVKFCLRRSTSSRKVSTQRSECSNTRLWKSLSDRILLDGADESTDSLPKVGETSSLRMKKSTSLATMEGIFGESISSDGSRVGMRSRRSAQRVLKGTKSLEGATKTVKNEAIGTALGVSSASAGDDSSPAKGETRIKITPRNDPSWIPTGIESQNPCPFPSDSFSSRHEKNEEFPLLSRRSTSIVASVSSSDRLSRKGVPCSSQQFPNTIRTAKSDQSMADESMTSICSDMSTSSRFSTKIRRGSNRCLQGLSQSELFICKAQRPKTSSSSSSSKNAQWTSTKGNSRRNTTSTSDLSKGLSHSGKHSSLVNNSYIHMTTSAASSSRLLGDASMDKSETSTSSRLFSSRW